MEVKQKKLTLDFLSNVFDEISGVRSRNRPKFAFIIPTRARLKTSEYWDEIYELMPYLSKLPVSKRARILKKLPAMVIDSYDTNSQVEIGVVVYAGIHHDLVISAQRSFWSRYIVYRRLRSLKKFVEKDLQVSHIGLGGILPRLSKFGAIFDSKLSVTTGHAGTSWLMFKTFEDVLVETKEVKTVGFIGAGSIGQSVVIEIARSFPEINLVVYDIRESANESIKQSVLDVDGQIEIARDNEDLIRRSDIIMSAVTSQIDISSIDVSNKVFIDDSQPGSIDLGSVRSQDSCLRWVVGSISSSQIRRRSSYNFGAQGLMLNTDYWGCESEVIVNAFNDAKCSYTGRQVGHGDVKNVGQSLGEYGVTVSRPQAFGQYTDSLDH